MSFTSRTQSSMPRARVPWAIRRRPRLPSVETACLAVLSLLVLVLTVLRALTRFPGFDESMHVRFLWLLSTGLKPETDYFCQYPALAYILAMPVVKLLPDSAYIVLALRATSIVMYCAAAALLFRHGRNTVGSGAAGLLPALLIFAAADTGAFCIEYSIDALAALAAIWAMTLFFRPPTARSVAMACGLALLSVVFTPKYPLPLFFGLLGYLAAALFAAEWRRRIKLVAAAALGSLAAALLVVLLYWVAGVSLADNFHYAHSLMSRFNLDKQSRAAMLPPGIIGIAYLSQHWLLTPVLVISLVCWAVRARREGLLKSLPGGGVILGMAAFTVVAWKNLVYEQYMTPMLLSTALFAPYAFPNRRAGRVLKWLEWSFLAAVGVVVGWQYLSIPAAFHESQWSARSSASITLARVPLLKASPMLEMVRLYDSSLRRLPNGERVVAVWPFHPMLRRDLTWITNDDIPSFSRYLAPDDPALQAFSPEAFREALETRPPAYIAPEGLEVNYPPGWAAVCVAFLQRHASSYSAVEVFAGHIGFFRRDLVPSKSAAANLPTGTAGGKR